MGCRPPEKKGISMARIVTADQRPARMVAGILIRAKQQIAVAETCVARLKLAIDQFHSLERSVNEGHIGSGLITRFYIVDSAQFV